MKIIPNSILRNVVRADRRTLLGSLAVLATLALLITCGTVFLAQEAASSDDCPTEKITSFFEDKQPESVVVTGNDSFLVHLNVDGKDHTFCYEKDDSQTVLDLLYRNDVYLNEDDTINYGLTEELEADMSVEVGRVTYKEVTERQSIPFETEKILTCFALSPTQKDNYGHRLKNTQGSPGVREITKRVKIVDGEVVEETVVSSKVITKPQNAVIHVDASYLLNLGDGAPTAYEEKLDFRFTAYTYNETGPSPTATGEACRVGYVAVDRSVIPMHSYLYIELDNGFVYGYCYAKDVGGAIKGNIVDVFLPSEIDCYWFGRRTGTVYVINKGA